VPPTWTTTWSETLGLTLGERRDTFELLDSEQLDKNHASLTTPQEMVMVAPMDLHPSKFAVFVEFSAIPHTQLEDLFFKLLEMSLFVVKFIISSNVLYYSSSATFRLNTSPVVESLIVDKDSGTKKVFDEVDRAWITPYLGCSTDKT